MPTLTIDNFSGKITREKFGDINSGFMPIIASPSGVYPFNNVGYQTELGFLEGVISTVGGAILAEPITHFYNIANPYQGTIAMSIGTGLSGNVYMVSQAGDTTDSSVKWVNNIGATATSFYGGGLYVGNLATTAASGTAVAYAGHDFGVAMSSDLLWLTATWSNIGSGWVSNVPRPIVNFAGKAYVGNGNNIAEIITGNTVSTYQKLNPSLPTNWIIRDMQVSADGKYLVIIASFLSDPTNSLKLNGVSGSSGNQTTVGCWDSVVLFWNGVDATYNQLQFFKGINLSSIAVSNTEALVFGKDDEGVGLWDLGGNKIVPISETFATTASYPPLPGSVYCLGRKIFFLMQYGNVDFLFCLDRTDNSLYSLYSTSPGVENIKGAVTIPSVHASTITNTDYSLTKIWFSISKIPISTLANNLIYRQNLQFYGNATLAGSYVTQVQKMFKKIKLDEIRVFRTASVSGDSFSLQINGPGLTAISGNSTFTYAFTAGTDKTLGQGTLDVIKLKPQLKEMAEIGVQINNISGQPAIHKIEIDYTEIPEPKTLR